MPFSDMTIMIAEDDRTLARLWERICVEVGFKAVIVTTVKDGLDRINDADILLVDLILLDGRADLLIETWIEDRHGPMVCVSGIADEQTLRDHILHGACNAFPKPDFTNEMWRTLAARYGRYVLLQRSVETFGEQIDSLKKRVRLQNYAIAALTALVLGQDLWKILAPLF